MKELPENLTIGEAYGPAMNITDPQEAAEYFEALVQHNMKYFGTPREEAERIERINLGYYAGYYSSTTRERVESLFSCAHPVFGAIAENGAPTAEEAFEAGRKMAVE